MIQIPWVSHAVDMLSVDQALVRPRSHPLLHLELCLTLPFNWILWARSQWEDWRYSEIYWPLKNSQDPHSPMGTCLTSGLLLCCTLALGSRTPKVFQTAVLRTLPYAHYLIGQNNVVCSHPCICMEVCCHPRFYIPLLQLSLQAQMWRMCEYGPLNFVRLEFPYPRPAKNQRCSGK